jgi:hypothetical protein
VHLKQLFLHEMIARVVKVAVHRSLRKKTRTLKIMSEVACKDVVVKHFNLVPPLPQLVDAIPSCARRVHTH